MMKNILYLLLLIIMLKLVGDSQQNMNNALDKFKNGIWNGAGNMIDGMGTSFGMVPEDMNYSFVVYNETPNFICPLTEKVVNFMGATFDGSIEDAQPPVLKPFSDSGNTFYKRHLLFTVWILGESLAGASSFLSWDALMAKFKISTPSLNVFGFKIGGELFSDFISSALGVILGPAIHEELSKYSLLDKMIPLQKFNPEDYYYYRAYADSTGTQAEYLGAMKTTDQFAGVFFNNTKVPVTVTFVKDNKEYTVVLIPDSFSLLNSNESVANSIRPTTLLDANSKPNRVFDFKLASNKTSLAQIPLAPQGIATVVCDPKSDPNNPSCKAGPSKTYTYEVFQTTQGVSIGTQGLSVGRFRQPYPTNKDVLKSVVRDINPCECHVWVQSAAQYNNAQSKNSDGSSVAVDVQEQIWVYYQIKDYVFKQKVTPGTVVDFTIIRPNVIDYTIANPDVSEKQGWLYVVSLATNDDTKAELFLQRLKSGHIGAGVNSDTIGDYTITGNLSKILNDVLPNHYGIIDDTQGADSSGIKGVVLLADGFTPRGLGTGPYYYTVAPPLLIPGQLSMMATSYTQKVDSLPDPQTVFNQNLATWILNYATNSAQVITQITQFLQQYGMDFIFTNPKDPSGSKILNDKGKIVLDVLLHGPLSIKNPPLLRQAGQNNYVFGLGAKPSDWPQ